MAGVVIAIKHEREFGGCQCCRQSDKELFQVFRPAAPFINDEMLLKVTDDLGEEEAKKWQQMSKTIKLSKECIVCCTRNNDDYWSISQLAEDR